MSVYGLTPGMADCARVIAALTSFDGRSPSYTEIAAELGLQSTGGVARLVQGLIKRGWIKPGPRAQRFSVITPRPACSVNLTRSPPPFDYSPIAITEAGREYLEQAA